MLQRVYGVLLAPRAKTEDGRRREFILNILLLGTVALSLLAVAASFTDLLINNRSAYSGAPPVQLLLPVALFTSMYLLARLGWPAPAAVLFVSALFLFASYTVTMWGIAIPQGILSFGLVVVIAGALRGSGAAFAVTGLATLVLVAVTYATHAGIVHPDVSWEMKLGQYSDALVFGATFLLVAVVAWLANRDITRALKRARASEAALKVERDNLEIKVRERTRELEEVQIEKMLQLQRFAEFGRLNATLIHDLASPLTAVSLSLEQLKQLNSRQKSDLLEAARQSAAAMEQYVTAARRQLQNRGVVQEHDPAEVIRDALPLVESRARAAGVRIALDLAEGLRWHGNSIQLNHVVCNLAANAIDAYDGLPEGRDRVVSVRLRRRGANAEITVRDHGMGITPGKLPRVFDAFYTTKYTPDNLGLGLSIVKQVVEEEFHGQVTAASSRQAGTRFVIVVPLT